MDDDKVIVDASKYNRLHKELKEVTTSLKELEDNVKREKGCFQIVHGRYTHSLSDNEVFTMRYNSVRFVNDIKNSQSIKDTLNRMEATINFYEKQTYDLIRVAENESKVSPLNTSKYQKQKYDGIIKDLDNKMRNEIRQEEKDKLETEKTKELQDKINKIPFWAKKLFGILE